MYLAVRSEFHCYHGHVEYLIIMEVRYLIISVVEEDTVYPFVQGETLCLSTAIFLP